jgi:acyl-coenzyme A synthetase/AMP-(fatty) acid ligase
MQSSFLPLLAHTSADDIVAHHDGEAISRARFIGEVRQLAQRLPAARHLLNACSDRYRFAVGLGAALLTGKICLLPPSLTPAVLAQLCRFSGDVAGLCDPGAVLSGIPCLEYPDDLSPCLCHEPVPMIEWDRQVAWIFTSGSTGEPQAHAKQWGPLVASVKAGAIRMGLCDGRRHTLVGTVPAQHMFGFEVSVLMAWHSAAAFHGGKPFHPVEINRAIASMPAPCTLVTTPYHLRTWLAGSGELPGLERIISATAPLSQTLAQTAELRCGARVYEIYGSTETGQLASRQPALSQEWLLYDGLKLRQDGEYFRVSGGHVESEMPLQDLLQPLDCGRFLLLGRNADLVNIAGKRSSLAYLNLQINAIAGVEDAVYFMPPNASVDGVTRPMAFVVAPGLDAAEIRAALRQSVDPVFLPRPLYFVDALPRNDSGKLPWAALCALARDCRKPGEQNE